MVSQPSEGTRMSDYLIKAGAQGPTTLIDKSFTDSRPYQAFLEAYRNVEQALDRDRRGQGLYWGPFLRGERPDARFVVDAHQIENGAVKMLLWNTAPPMTPDEMRRYFTTVGSSHEGAAQYSSISRDGQLGQGFRQGTLPWNTYGVVAIAVDPDLGGADGASMMWMHKVPLAEGGPQVYAIKPLPAYQDPMGHVVEDVVAPVQTVHGIDFISMIPVEVAEYGGMVFVMLGNDLSEHTFNGAAIKRETGAGICKFLNNATLDGRLCTVTFPTPDSASGGGKRIEIDGKQVRFDRRRLKSYDQWMQGRVRADGSPATVEQGVLTNEETGVTYVWAAGPLDLKESRHDVWNGKGHIVAPYKTDVHQVLPSATAADRGFAFGMLAKTASVVALQVILPIRVTDEDRGLRVEQSLDRSRLILASGQDIPWRELGRWFAEHLPEPIARLNAEVEASSQRQTMDLRACKARMTGYLSGLKTSETNIEDPDGDEPGDPLGRSARGSGQQDRGGQESPSSGRRQGPRELDRNPEGVSRGRLRQQADLPEVKWLSQAEWDEQVGEEHDHAVVYRRGVTAVLFMAAQHQMVKHLTEVIVNELRQETGLVPDVTYPRDYLDDRVRHHMTCDLLCTVGHVEKVFAKDPDSREVMLTPAALTAHAAGFDSVIEVVKAEIKASRRIAERV